jgi:hypothetical protein
MGMMTQSSRSLASRETPSPPTWRAKYRSRFTTLSPEPLRQQPAVILLWGRHLASWLLALGERGGHDDLRGLGRQSLIPYIHERTELYCSSLYEPEPFLFSNVKVVLRHFHRCCYRSNPLWFFCWRGFGLLVTSYR